MANDNQLQLRTSFIVTRNEGDYRNAAKHWISEQDVVLEVGCKDGTTTALIAANSKIVIGIDHTKEAIKVARELHPDLHFEVVDGFDVSHVQNLNKNFDVILVNMAQLAGYSSLLDTIYLVNMYATIFKPRVVIVNNRALKSFVSRCSAWDPSPEGIKLAKDLQKSRGTKFVGTRGVDEFRASIDVWITDTDKVLEIGCEWGTTTELILPQAQFVIGTDISVKCIERARKMRPNIKFEVLDGFKVRDALELKVNFDKIYIDISGLSGYRSVLDVISLLKTYEMMLRPKAIIIKSGGLKHFATHFVAWNPQKCTNEK